jgi:hypothetical protein
LYLLKKKKKKTMVGTVLELCTLEELAELEENDPAERARWVVSAPEPNYMFHEKNCCFALCSQQSA